MYKLIDVSNLENLNGFNLGLIKSRITRELISKFGGDSTEFEIYDEQTAIKETLAVINLNNAEAQEFFVGENREEYTPGKIDLNYALFIGQTAYSAPIALYFKNSLVNPEVIHFVIKDNSDVWIRVFSSYREMLKFI